LERMWKDVIMAKFKVLSLLVPVRSERNS
jgi:hypothetical protein